MGDACQDYYHDTDGDGLPDNADDCVWRSPDPDADCDELGQNDADGDGIPNLRDICPYVDNPDQQVGECEQDKMTSTETKRANTSMCEDNNGNGQFDDGECEDVILDEVPAYRLGWRRNSKRPGPVSSGRGSDQ